MLKLNLIKAIPILHVLFNNMEFWGVVFFTFSVNCQENDPQFSANTLFLQKTDWKKLLI